MKKSLFVLTLFLITFINSNASIRKLNIIEKDLRVISVNGDDAIDYNDKIVGLQIEILEDMMTMMKLEGKNIIKDLKGTIKITKKAIKSLKKMKVYPGGDEMKRKALDLFNFYLETMEGPWMEALILFDEKGSNMNEEELARFNKLVTEPGKKEVKYDEAFAKAQNTFAKANGFEIQRNPFQDEIDKN